MSKTEPAIAFFKITWDFITKFEIAGTSFKGDLRNYSDEELTSNFVLSFADTIKVITEDSKLSDFGLREKKDGIVLLIDEVDKASEKLNLGAFLKNLTETLVQEDANKFMLILSGLPRARDVLKESHESSLRLFEELKLDPLSMDEIKHVVDSGLSEAKGSGFDVKVTDDALKHIYVYSEGYPHFVQQIAYSAFEIDNDNNITVQDVETAMFNKGGALDLIGDRYYRDLYYEKIKDDSYRQILKIMSQSSNRWISKQDIQKEYVGKRSTLNNGLKALRDRNIILAKTGARGLYRLQWIGFAVWIKTINERKLRQINTTNQIAV